MKKIILIIMALGFIGFLAFVIKTASRLTPGKSVIKKYSYSGGANEFISHVQKFSAKDSNVVSKITDTTGTAQRGYAFYMNIELKNSGHGIFYAIACNSDSAAAQTAIELIMALDTTNNVGGYNKKAKGIQPLVNNFEVNFLTPLSNSQNIKITPL